MSIRNEFTVNRFKLSSGIAPITFQHCEIERLCFVDLALPVAHYTILVLSHFISVHSIASILQPKVRIYYLVPSHNSPSLLSVSSLISVTYIDFYLQCHGTWQHAVHQLVLHSKNFISSWVFVYI
jgi:hypothetical protein